MQGILHRGAHSSGPTMSARLALAAACLLLAPVSAFAEKSYIDKDCAEEEENKVGRGSSQRLRDLAKLNLGLCYSLQGSEYRETKDFKRAAVAYEKAITEGQDDHDDLGKMLIRSGGGERGVRLFTRYVEEYPEMSRLYDHLRVLLEMTGDNEQGVLLFTRYIEARPETARFYSYRAHFRKELGAWDLAVEDIETYGRMKSERTRAFRGFYREKLRYHRSRGEYKEMRSALLRLIVVNPKSRRLWGRLADLLKDYSNDYAPCVKAYSEVIKLSPKGFSRANSESGKIGYYGGRAFCRARSGDRDGQLADLITDYRIAVHGRKSPPVHPVVSLARFSWMDSYLKRIGANKKTYREGVLEAGKWLGAELIGRGDLKAENLVFGIILGLSSSSRELADIYYWRGTVHRFTGYYVEAEKHLKRAIAFQDSLRNQYALGLLYAELHEKKKVERICSRLDAWAEGGQTSKVRWLCGSLHQDMEDYAAAIDIYTKGLAGGNAADKNLLEYRGTSYAKAGRGGEAFKDAERLKKRLIIDEESLASYHLLISHAHEALGEYKKAHAAYREYLLAESGYLDRTPGQMRTAEIYLKAGKKRKALAEMKLLLAKHLRAPRYPRAYRLRAKIYDARGKRAKAAADRDKAAALEEKRDPVLARAGLTASLQRLLKSSDSAWRESAAWFLSNIGTPETDRALIAALKDPSPAVRRRAAASLGTRGDPQAAKLLEEAFASGGPRLKGLAALALTDMEMRGAKNPALEVMRRRGTEVRRAAFDHLRARIDGPPWLEKKDWMTTRDISAKILRLARRMSPAPAVPEAAKASLERGKTKFIAVKGNNLKRSDYGAALKEYLKAVKLAPWWPDAYYGLAAVYEIAKDFPEAIIFYRLYMAAPAKAYASADADRLRRLEYQAGW